MARSPNRAVIEGNPRLIASSFLLVLHRSSSDPQSIQHPAVREAEHDLLMQPHIHFTQSLVIGGAAATWPLGPSCVSPPPQLNSESSPWLEFARIPGNLLGLSNV